jgi:hypothetical protein
MSKTVSQLRDELADREAIRDCLYRYSRAIDRCDMDLLRTVYWPDAIDTHLGFQGNVEQLIAWALPKLRNMDQNMHLIGNILIELDGHRAAVESYFWSLCVIVDGTARDIVACGRYLDRFERRDDTWRIAERLVVTDGFRNYPDSSDWVAGPFGTPSAERGVPFPKDKSYTWLGLHADRTGLLGP